MLVAPGAERVEVGGGVIEVEIGPPAPSVAEAALLQWVETSASAVARYLGRFPVPRVRLQIATGGSGGVRSGTTWGGEVPSIRVPVGRRATAAALTDDWVLTHELVHLAFPDTPRAQHWIEEGLATYVEPVARARQGLVSEESVWRDFLNGMPQGLADLRDAGLDGNRGWGATYWGGALFWLLADVELREKTGGRRGVEDALGGILDAGGSIRVSWELAQTLDAGDKAVGEPVLRRLHARMGPSPVSLDLDALWARLGVARRGEGVVFDDAAPLAAIRRAITARTQAVPKAEGAAHAAIVD
jgi:hypothetical protein